jgi:hypothetical protein
VYKRSLQDFSSTEPVPQRIVPYMDVVQDRLAVEVLRGCARGCRFCQAGMTYRPVRERPAEQVVAAAREGLALTGHDEVSLTSLSTTDHSQCAQILHMLNEDVRGTGVRVSIPSQRLDSFGVEMAAEVGGSKRGGLTFAPEAGSQRLRDVINKNVTEKDIDTAAENAFRNGWRRMKLYFMMGLPTETDDDIVAINETADRVLEIGRSVVGRGPKSGVSVSVSVAVFVPKAYTPFQWCGQLDLEEVHSTAAAAVEHLPGPRHQDLVPRRGGLAHRGRALEGGAPRLRPHPRGVAARLPLRRVDGPVLVRALDGRGGRGGHGPGGDRLRRHAARRAPAVGAHVAGRVAGVPEARVPPRGAGRDDAGLHEGELRGLRRVPEARC